MSTRNEATILHVDMDSFFVSVELLERPELRGLPSVVSQGSGRSVVSSASYEARPYGVRSAMPLARARQLCPHLVVIPPTFEKYRAASREVMRIFRDYTPLVEPLSIDEAFLDVAGATKLFGPPAQIAQYLRTRIRQETGLPASVGIASNKFVAKLASERAKPDGLLEVPAEQTLEFLHPLPVEALWGVGGSTAKRLHSQAIRRIRDLAETPLDTLTRMLGASAAQRLHDLSRGVDPRSVQPERTEKSLGHEETFATDQTDQTVLERELLRLATRTGERLRKHRVRARTIAIKLRWSDFQTLTRSRTIAEATDSTQRIYATARDLFRDAWPVGRPVRLIGVRAEQLLAQDGLDAGLWSDDDEWRPVERAADEIRERFGEAGLRSARLLGPRGERVDPRSGEPLR